jgi:conjugative transposon TraM protein
MESKALTQKALRQRKLFLALPLLVLPFITLMFWALGGGTVQASGISQPLHRGFNMKLPNPNLKDDNPLDKMSYYDQAALEAQKRDELIKKDPNYQSQDPTVLQQKPGGDSLIQNRAKNTGLNTSGYQNPKEERVQQRLAALQKAINKPRTDFRKNPSSGYTAGNDPKDDPSGLAAMEQAVQAMGQPGSPDPELQQLSGMLETIVDIQHPERMQEKLRKASQEQRGQVFAVSHGDEGAFGVPQSMVGHGYPITTQPANGFYSLEDNNAAADPASPNAVEAVIHETQTLVNGSTVKLRLTTDVFVNGTLVPKNSFLFGIASLKGERLNISVTGLRYGDSLFPVSLSVFDMDGLDGIYIPGAISRDVAKASANSSMQTLGVTTLDDSWGAQAAGAGVEMAKTLFSKKVKLIKVVVKAGYRVLLKDEKQKKN